LKNDESDIPRQNRRSNSANFSQVSCLERIANEAYAKKRVSPTTVFGKFLSDCKDQLILAKCASKYMKHKSFRGEKIRLKRDFKSKISPKNPVFPNFR
jgi:hypothetical protein